MCNLFITKVVNQKRVLNITEHLEIFIIIPFSFAKIKSCERKYMEKKCIMIEL